MNAKQIAFLLTLASSLLFHLYIQVTTWGDYWANLITVLGVFVVLFVTVTVVLVVYALLDKLSIVVRQVFLGALVGFAINMIWARSANVTRKKEEFAYRSGPYANKDSISFRIQSDTLTTIPMEMIAKEKVQIIVITSKALKTVPMELVEVKNLRQLNLFGAENLDLEQALTVISKLNLEELLINSSTGYFPPELSNLKSVKTLYLEGNEDLDLDSMFVLLSVLPNLEHLHLHHAKAKHLPESISKIERLKSLHLSFGDFVDMPASLMEMDSLNTLVLNKTPVYSHWWEYLDSTKIRFKVLPKRMN